MIRLAFLRHGVTVWNREGRIQGRTDIPLDEEGRERVGRRVLPDGWRDAVLHASPLSRAVETAGLLAAGRPIRTDARLVEMDWGDWEGRRGVDLRADPASGYRDLEEWGWDFRPPGGESPADVRGRLGGWLAERAGEGAPAHLVVTHIGVIRVALALAWGWDFRGPPPLLVKRDRLYAMTLADDGTLRPAGGPDGERLPCR
ncbi:histidine phosphatase family protein [Azospirillum picis]|uniref:Phosphoglycerate mutase n=1 Tax=Azospirillum picis TaxID=488438 RepID=A0ABU0MQI0_9PROT|nr:histidine phosphatase family protein [Azospirillum picis]MBP2302153.1 putative phosphoglycerate mutase [Azospirillum picis]MDQ0535732.1 putative phosphoglycerate mutase [Azospirillum picis]